MVDKLVDECTENTEETNFVEINSVKCKHNSCILHIALFSIIFIINAGIGAYFVYHKYVNRNKENIFKYEKKNSQKIDDCESIHSVNPYWGYIEEKGVNKYSVFDSTDENKDLLKKYNDAFNGIRAKIKKVNSTECDYEKDYMKIKFHSDDNLPLKKPAKFNNMNITIRSVIEEDGKLHPQVYLDDSCMN